MHYRRATRSRPDPIRRWTATLFAAALLTQGAAHAETAFLVAAPDRGFVGNEETRAAFAALAERYPAELVFVTDERTRDTFARALATLRETGADKFVVLPFYLAPAHPDLQRIETLADNSGLPVTIAEVFGRTMHAVAILADRFEALPGDAHNVVVVGLDPSGNDAMRADLMRLARAAADRFRFESLDVLLTGADRAALAQQLSAAAPGSTLVPFHLGSKHDGMMSRTARIQRRAPDSVRVVSGGVTPHPAVAAWLQREAARYTLDAESPIGVIVHAHGADFHWNERMRAASAPLAADYLVEYAFSMADPATLERALDRLVQRGAQAVVLVRVYGMSESFRPGIERLVGADYERGDDPGQGGHGHHGAPAPRIVSPVPVVTTGGLDDSPLFARALLDRALELSDNPAEEAVLVIAHGKRRDADDALWMERLRSIRRQMLAAGGDAFAAIELGTWREDWPDKREASLERIRKLFDAAEQRGHRVLLVPARTNAQGPARRLLPDREFALGEGFAGHPLFDDWLHREVQVGVRQLMAVPASE